MCGLFARGQADDLNFKWKSGPVPQNVRRLEKAQNCGGGPDGVVGLAPCHEADGPGLNTDWGRELFVVQTDPEAPSKLLYKGYRVFNVVKRPERDADHSPPSSVELRMGWSYTPTFCLNMSGHFMGWYLPLKIKLTLCLKCVLTFVIWK